MKKPTKSQLKEFVVSAVVPSAATAVIVGVPLLLVYKNYTNKHLAIYKETARKTSDAYLNHLETLQEALLQNLTK